MLPDYTDRRERSTMTSAEPIAASTSMGEAPGADAAPGGDFDCDVDLAGTRDDGSVAIFLRERHGAFARWYEAGGSAKREMLATALTAIATGKPVGAFLTTTDEHGTIQQLFVRRY
jgi:hypothetical protein